MCLPDFGNPGGTRRSRRRLEHRRRSGRHSHRSRHAIEELNLFHPGPLPVSIECREVDQRRRRPGCQRRSPNQRQPAQNPWERRDRELRPIKWNSGPVVARMLSDYFIKWKYFVCSPGGFSCSSDLLKGLSSRARGSNLGDHPTLFLLGRSRPTCLGGRPTRPGSRQSST